MTRETKEPKREAPKSAATPKNRKFDSIAWLIQESDKDCGATWFDGEHIVLATNSRERTALINEVSKYLVYVAIKSSEAAKDMAKLSTKTEKDTAVKQLKAKCKEKREDLYKYAKIHIDLLIRKDPTFTADYERSLKKITKAIQCTYLDPSDESALSLESAEAIRKGIFIFVSGSGIHAEMKIAKTILSRISSKEIRRGGQYIGISKRCCRNCEAVIFAINNCNKSTQISQGVNENIIDVRGTGHKIPFPSAIPRFLDEPRNFLIKEEFLKIVQKKSLEDAFRESSEGYSTGEEHHDASSEIVESENSFEDLDNEGEDDVSFNFLEDKALGRSFPRSGAAGAASSSSSSSSRRGAGAGPSGASGAPRAPIKDEDGFETVSHSRHRSRAPVPTPRSSGSSGSSRGSASSRGDSVSAPRSYYGSGSSAIYHAPKKPAQRPVSGSQIVTAADDWPELPSK